MTREREKQLLSIANASGFPLQMSVARQVKTTLARRGWKVLVTEHPWRDPETGRVEFIDLVVERDSVRLVIECKRVTQGQWVFLHDPSGNSSKNSARIFSTRNLRSGDKEAEWIGSLMDPASVESVFCAIRGSGEQGRATLERLAYLTCKATEAFGTQELTIKSSPSFDLSMMYVPVIITTAELVTCSADPDTIDVGTGLLTGESVEFDSVSLVRFRKPLGLQSDLSAFADVSAVNRDAERTVFILQSADLVESLGNMHFSGLFPDSPRTRHL
jgi:hypothetical protein